MQDKATRRFSLDDDFMNYKTDDLLYGFMRCLSTARPEGDGWKEYLPVSSFSKEKKTIANILGCTSRTIGNRLQKLIDCGLVELGQYEVEKHGKVYQYDCYYFPYDYDGNFKILDRELVKYLVYTRNACAIRIYLYLLNCSTMKQDYTFTIQEIKEGMGYASSTKTADEMIRSVLTSFKKEGVIKFEEIYEERVSPATGKVVPVPKMVLKFVATKMQQF